ncbi:MAG: C-terminal helicase domain-containing protein, partial [Burkholderiales bacterium]
RLQCALQIMRMACNSTYLVDHETDHGNKVDELMAVLDELLEDPSAKVVVFSQWLATHELIVRRLGRGAGQRDWGHVQFNGSVPGDKRGALVEQFHDDPDCRLFLSTDAGGVGLNLQHAAAVVINMDMPWNPAVLEQRIGRVHRMGQERGVQVVNFVGQGSIEEGMLSVLAFKTSLFAGVLDGGASEVFLQGTKLSKFMESVEQVAGAMGEADEEVETQASGAGVADFRSAIDDALEPATAGPAEPAPPAADDALEPAPSGLGEPMSTAVDAVPAPATDSAGPGTEPADPWAAILEAGAAMLQGLAQARAAGEPAAPPFAIECDSVTGRASVRLPLPEPAVLQKLAKALAPWLR